MRHRRERRRTPHARREAHQDRAQHVAHHAARESRAWRRPHALAQARTDPKPGLVQVRRTVAGDVGEWGSTRTHSWNAFPPRGRRRESKRGAANGRGATVDEALVRPPTRLWFDRRRGPGPTVDEGLGVFKDFVIWSIGRGSAASSPACLVRLSCDDKSHPRDVANVQPACLNQGLNDRVARS